MALYGNLIGKYFNFLYIQNSWSAIDFLCYYKGFIANRYVYPVYARGQAF
jgi:hypothetical protein